MQAKGFFASLFDFSFSSFVTPKVIKVLYALGTAVVSLWTLLFVLWAFKLSTGFGIVTLLLLAPIFFVISMLYMRVLLELLIVFFRIHGDVAEINQRGGGGSNGVPSVPPLQPAAPAPTVTPTEAAGGSTAVATATAPPLTETAPEVRYCANCGAEQAAGKRFCTSCGQALE
ncbi:MAG TPA: DUF4282 domain-containing protein [Gaiellaceae bacterium]